MIRHFYVWFDDKIFSTFVYQLQVFWDKEEKNII